MTTFSGATAIYSTTDGPHPVEAMPEYPVQRSMPAPHLVERAGSLRCLGPLECWWGRRQVEIRGVYQRTLLAALIVMDCRPVSAEALIEELWGEEPPIKADNALQAHISRLRRKLVGHPTVSLVSSPSGYVLLTGGDVDATMFMRALDQVRGGSARDTATDVTILRSALALWRGPVFGASLNGPICHAAAARYEAARWCATELLFDLELRRGRHVEIIPELTELTEVQPLNERFCEQLMVALYRSGRQTEALDMYRRLRTMMDDHLGVAPSPEVRKYEQAILAHDPVLHVSGDFAALRDRSDNY
jgi:DNA-binding SARP family transcriptional activator